MQSHFVLNSIQDTKKMAREIAGEVRAGQILALSGPIGAGKTTFVKAFAAALGIEKTIVSPTYTLLQPYTLPRAVNGIKTLVHIDAYRLESAEELTAIGFEDFLNDPTALIVIEWAEKVEKILVNQKIITLNFSMDDSMRACEISW